MFKRDVLSISEVLALFMRQSGIETPLRQRRLMALWGEVAGPTAARYTGRMFISGQTLHVKLTNAALRSDLSMSRTALVKRLNNAVGAHVISDIHFF